MLERLDKRHKLITYTILDMKVNTETQPMLVPTSSTLRTTKVEAPTTTPTTPVAKISTIGCIYDKGELIEDHKFYCKQATRRLSDQTVIFRS